MFLSDLLSFLYIGLTEGILAFSEKHELSKSVFMMLVRCLSITSTDSFIILTGIPSGPVAFLGFRCLISIFISSFLLQENYIYLRIRAFFSNLINTWIVFIIVNYCINRSDFIAWSLGLPNTYIHNVSLKFLQLRAHRL